MSIFATWLLLAEDGDAAAPRVYKGSHADPEDGDPRGGWVEVAAIPNHCHPAVRWQVAPSDGLPVEYLRLSVGQAAEPSSSGLPGQATVILDRAQVEDLHETLGAWLTAEER
ncbi:hypothetical protein ACGFX4_07260 [Kitasatospora sp. NPDC048365]|uniref:hypothetical protein n=1 Tax=Kitasatospora sp. NPDC048365 TaxID=3364050 RepID=UPI00371BBAB5